MPIPLLATKLHIPPLRPDFVPRRRLLDRLQTGLLRKLILISAPAGYGKTTVLSEWHASSQDGVLSLAWVLLDEQDNDPVRFWSVGLFVLPIGLAFAGVNLARFSWQLVVPISRLGQRR